MHSDYHIPAMRELRDQQVRFAPRDKKLEQVDRAEKLIAEIDPERTYTYEYLCFRITEFRPEVSPDVAMSGDEALHDLRLFVEDVSDAANVPVEEVGEPVYTVEELSKKFNVSTKTISRWRQQGLVSRRFVFDGRKRVGFLKSCVERFVASNPERVQRGGRFSQLTEAERTAIIERARRLAQAGGGPAEVTRRVAKHMSRSVETIRYTLKQFDQEHPGHGDLPRPHRAADARGEAEDLPAVPPRRRRSTRWPSGIGRTKTSIYRIVNEMRAHAILELPLDYIPNAEFDRAGRREGDPRPAAASRPSCARRRGCRPACRRTWLACTRCRC